MPYTGSLREHPERVSCASNRLEPKSSSQALKMERHFMLCEKTNFRKGSCPENVADMDTPISELPIQAQKWTQYGGSLAVSKKPGETMITNSVVIKVCRPILGSPAVVLLGASVSHPFQGARLQAKRQRNKLLPNRRPYGEQRLPGLTTFSACACFRPRVFPQVLIRRPAPTHGPCQANQSSMLRTTARCTPSTGSPLREPCQCARACTYLGSAPLRRSSTLPTCAPAALRCAPLTSSPVYTCEMVWIASKENGPSRQHPHAVCRYVTVAFLVLLSLIEIPTRFRCSGSLPKPGHNTTVWDPLFAKQ